MKIIKNESLQSREELFIASDCKLESILVFICDILISIAFFLYHLLIFLYLWIVPTREGGINYDL